MGSVLEPLGGGAIFCVRPPATEFTRLDGVELPESDCKLIRRVVTGIREGEVGICLVGDGEGDGFGGERGAARAGLKVVAGRC